MSPQDETNSQVKDLERQLAEAQAARESSSEGETKEALAAAEKAAAQLREAADAELTSARCSQLPSCFTDVRSSYA